MTLPPAYLQALDNCRKGRSNLFKLSGGHLFDPNTLAPDMLVWFAEYHWENRTPCEHCGLEPTEARMHFPKHRLSMAFGGDDSWENFMILCTACSKNALEEDGRRIATWENDRRVLLLRGIHTLPPIPPASWD